MLRGLVRADGIGFSHAAETVVGLDNDKNEVAVRFFAEMCFYGGYFHVRYTHRITDNVGGIVTAITPGLQQTFT